MFGVHQLGGGAGLAEELLRLLTVELPAGNLDGHDAVELRVFGLPDRAETAVAQLLDQLEPPDLLPSPRAAGRLVRRRVVAGQPERPAALRADDLGQRDVVADFDRVAAVGANDVQGPQRKMAIAHPSGDPRQLAGDYRVDFPRIPRKPRAVIGRRRLLARGAAVLQFDRQELLKQARSGGFGDAVQIVFHPRPRAGFPGRLEPVANLVDLVDRRLVRRRLMGRKFHADRSGAVSHHPSIVSQVSRPTQAASGPRHNKLTDLLLVVQASRLHFQAGGTPAPQKS